MQCVARRAAWAQRVLVALLTVLCLIASAPSSAQERQPYRGPVLDLLEAPVDGVEYWRTRQRVETLLSEQQFTEALPLAESLVQQYPRDGANWHLLGRASAGAGQHAAAAEAFGEAGDRLGWRTPYYTPGVLRAEALLNAGDREGALRTLEQEVGERRNFYLRTRLLTWPGFEALREEPRFLALAAQPEPGVDTAEGRRRDLDHLRAELLRVDPDHHGGPLPVEFETRFEALHRRAAELSGPQFFVAIGHLLASLQHGHTGFFPPADAMVLPVRFYAFPEGVFVVAADEAYADLVGRRLVSIGGAPVEDVLRSLAEHRSVDGPMQHVWGTNDLASVYWLQGLGLTEGDGAELVFEAAQGAPSPVWLTARLPSGQRQDRLPPPPHVTAPLWLSDVDNAHWLSNAFGPEVVYAQFNQVRPKPGQSVAAFGLSLRESVNLPAVHSLVLDLRHNNGGDTNSYRELLRTLIAFKTRPETEVYVLTGRRTYSAAANFITDLERLVQPVFIGEAASACCHFYGDPAQVVLPYSGLRGEISAVRWNLSYDVFDGRRELSPHVPVQLTHEAYRQGRDPVLETALRLSAERLAAQGR